MRLGPWVTLSKTPESSTGQINGTERTCAVLTGDKVHSPLVSRQAAGRNKGGFFISFVSEHIWSLMVQSVSTSNRHASPFLIVRGCARLRVIASSVLPAVICVFAFPLVCQSSRYIGAHPGRLSSLGASEREAVGCRMVLVLDGLKVSGGGVAFRVKLAVMSDTLLMRGQVCAKWAMCELVIRDRKVKSQICLCSRRVSIVLSFFQRVAYVCF